MGEAAHGPAGVDFADAMPGEAIVGIVEKRVDADRAVIPVGIAERRKGLEDFFFGSGEDFVCDETGLLRWKTAGGLGGRGGGKPSAFWADLLVAETKEAKASLIGGVGLVEEGEFEGFGEPGFDKARR